MHGRQIQNVFAVIGYSILDSVNEPKELVMILDLHRQGLSVSAIARRFCIDRKTVRSAIAKGVVSPKYKTRAPRSRITDPFEPYLKERLVTYPGLTAVRL
jgi:transposase